MIPILLWQCPLCHTDDALRHKTRWLKPDELRCTHCGTVWEVQRVIGDDFLLTVVQGEASTIGWQQPLAEWYDLMKAGLKLLAKERCSLRLDKGEECYLQSRRVKLLVEEDNPLLCREATEEAPSQKEGEIGLSFMRTWDRGRLSLTNERLIWTGERGNMSFQLKKVNSVHTEVTWYLGVLYGLRRYKFRFRDESILKWLTYIALASRRIEQHYRHQISLSNY